MHWNTKHKSTLNEKALGDLITLCQERSKFNNLKSFSKILNLNIQGKDKGVINTNYR